ncbi:MAG: phosphoglucosamine mutase [Gammaproteobacteria bacterium]|nr:phosphoglucosamine mutase [Gammaproteobacteria bacterium]
MKTKNYFGTDGIRGKVGEDPITAEFMLRLGWAAGKVFSRQGRGRILIGKDTRISGYMFESALEAGLASAGIDVMLLGPMPTPAIAYLTRTFNANAGIVISASHNPYYDNGVKFFSGDGEKLDDEIEFAIEQELDSTMRMVESKRIGKVTRIDDAAGRYIEFCKSCFPSEYNLKGRKIVVDCAHGATYHIAPSVFRELGAQVIEIGVDPDGFNINQEVGSTTPEVLAEKVQREEADFGVALDGDGDRVIMVDHMGEVVDGDELLLIIAVWRKQCGSLDGGVVGTLMSNFGLEKALQNEKIPFVRAAVGDRYVLAELQDRNWKVGGESSGHIICLNLTSTGDGIISALQVMAAMESLGRNLHEIKKMMEKYPQRMINVKCKQGTSIESAGPVNNAVKATEKKLNGKGRVLLRPSGTEPVVRVMVEGEDRVLVEELVKDLAEVVEQALG